MSLKYHETATKRELVDILMKLAQNAHVTPARRIECIQTIAKLRQYTGFAKRVGRKTRKPVPPPEPKAEAPMHDLLGLNR
jgi:hypothetical protein